MRVVTIGVYGFDRESFVARLQHADVRVLLDVRQRRGVRGPEYAWANSLRLQAALAQAGIAYEHHPELAPTTGLRQLQYAEDDRQGVGKRSRRSSRTSTPAATPPRSSTAPTSPDRGGPAEHRRRRAVLRRERPRGLPPLVDRPAAEPSGTASPSSTYARGDAGLSAARSSVASSSSVSLVVTPTQACSIWATELTPTIGVRAGWPEASQANTT